MGRSHGSPEDLVNPDDGGGEGQGHAGGFSTELTQTGDATAASDTSVTVRSQDGFSQTYVVNPDTRTPPQPPQPQQTGEQVSVRATQQGGAATATAVMPAR